MIQGWMKNTVRLGLVCGLSLLMGYATSSMAQTNQPDQKQTKQKEKKNKVPPLPEGVKLHKDQNIQGVWLGQTVFQLQGLPGALHRAHRVRRRRARQRD